jgi:glycosyltransferase involved in cell wall biosynthesis
MTERVDVSVVIPVFNEAESLPQLVRRTREALGVEHSWEILLVNDGSTDATGVLADRLHAADNRVRPLHLSRNFGQTAALQAGFDHVRGKVVVTMDGDLQNDPADIPKLLAKLSDGFDLVAGYRVARQDTLVTRKVPSVVANALIRRITGVSIRDNGCSLKAYRRDTVERLQLYSDLHRFIPAVAAATTGARIAEVPVRHHSRQFGQSKYGLSRVWKVLTDLLTLKMIRTFRERPLALFASGAVVATGIGFFFGVYTVVAELTFQRPEAIRALVFPSAALLGFGLGFYLLVLGLIAEVAVRERRVQARDGRFVLREVSA